MLKRISIIIPCHKKDKRDLDILLRQLKILEEIKDVNYEIIIIFNNFPNEKIRIKNRSKYIIKTFNKSLIIGHARNIGASLSDGDYLIFMDADISINKNSLLKLSKTIDQMEGLGYSALLPKFSIYNKASTFAVLDSEEDIRSYRSRIENGNWTEAASLGGPFVLIKRKVFFEIGEWEEKYICAEDKDLAARIINYGNKIMYAPEIIINHKNDSNLLAILKRKAFHAECNALAYERHPFYFHRSLKEWRSIIFSKYNSHYPMDSIIYMLIMLFYVIIFYIYRIKIRFFETSKIPFEKASYLHEQS